MDQRTGAVAQEVTKVISNRESVAEKLAAFERRLTEMAEDVTATYSRMLTETTDGVTRMADQTATVLNPLHQTREHPGVMLGVAVCTGYVIGRMQPLRSRMAKGRGVNQYGSNDTETKCPREGECR